VIGRFELEERVLAGLEDKLLAPELVRDFIAEFRAELNRRGRDAELAYEVARRERTEVERKIKAMVDAIENGIFTASTRDPLLELERPMPNSTGSSRRPRLRAPTRMSPRSTGRRWRISRWRSTTPRCARKPPKCCAG